MNCVNKYAVALCTSDNFWNERIVRVFKVNLSKYKEDDLTYRQVYFILRKTKSGIGLFSAAAEHGYLPLVKHMKESTITFKVYYYNALVLAARHGKVLVSKYLIENGARILPGDDETLKSVLEYEDISLLNILIEKMERVNLGLLYEVALKLAAKTGNIYITQYLKENVAGIDERANYELALKKSAFNGHLQIVKYIIENVENVPKTAALNYAAEAGHLQIVEYLIENGADISDECDSLVKISALHGHLHVLTFLKENGANIHVSDHLSLILAAGAGHLEVVEYLVENGANIHAQNDKAFRKVQQNGMYWIAAYLHSIHSVGIIKQRIRHKRR